VVAAAPNPPTTPADRFHLEVVSLAEHLRRLVADAREARDPAARGRLARELRGALRALRSGAESFGEETVAAFVADSSEAVAALDQFALDALDEVLRLLADPATTGEQIALRLGALSRGRAGAGATGGALIDATPDGGSAGGVATATPPAARAPARTPTGSELHALLEDGISRMDRLATTPLSQPVALVDESLVPIEMLFYRGRAALERAIAVRDAIRRADGTPPREALDEIFDLLDLAATE
jgi:hypothetical protein